MDYCLQMKTFNQFSESIITMLGAFTETWYEIPGFRAKSLLMNAGDRDCRTQELLCKTSDVSQCHLAIWYVVPGILNIYADSCTAKGKPM